MIKKRINPLLLTTLIILNGCGQKKDNSSDSKTQESLSLNEGDYVVEISTSKLTWTGKEVSTKQHNGTLNIKKGQIIISDKGLISGDIEIEITGLREGEKLYEELLIGDKVKRTIHKHIMSATEEKLSYSEVTDLIEKFENVNSITSQSEIKNLLQKSIGSPLPPKNNVVDIKNK